VQTSREDIDKINLASQRHLLNNFKLATELGGEVIKKTGENIGKIVAETAKEQESSLIIIGKPHFSFVSFILNRNLIQKILKYSVDTDIIIVS
jgi:two-component system sensor histidine kinase KdpD